eukprot:4004207-Pyramimonas_sp.AAC.1
MRDHAVRGPHPLGVLVRIKEHRKPEHVPRGSEGVVRQMPAGWHAAEHLHEARIPLQPCLTKTHQLGFLSD